jgi:membrane fusion protein, multidrug efflux system
MNRGTGKVLILAALAASLGLPGCQHQQAPPEMPPPEVAVVAIQPEHVVLTSELPGRTCGYLIAEIRPQVNGLIQKRLFTEGAEVKKGDVLYQIDPAPFQAALDSAAANIAVAKQQAERARAALGASTADLKRHQANLTLAKTNRQRYDQLLKNKAIAEMDHDQAINTVDVADATLRTAEAQVESDHKAVQAAEASIKQAEAAMVTARINLDYTKITAPISGRIGRSDITEGAIATAYQARPLSTIQQFDPIYIDVPQSTAELNRLRRNLANGRLKNNGTDKVKIVLEDGTAYPLEGSLQFRDVTVDPTTGSIILRIVVPNPDATLLPGMFVKAMIDEGINERAILVPQQAVSRDPKGNPIAMVVGAEDKVQQRSLTTDRAVGDKWLVTSGLAQGDRVIVEGLQKARPGTPVKAVPFAPAKKTAEKPDGTVQTVSQTKQQ